MTFEQFIEQSEEFKHLLHEEGTRNVFMKDCNGVYMLQAVRLAYEVWCFLEAENKSDSINAYKDGWASNYKEIVRLKDENEKMHKICIELQRTHDMVCKHLEICESANEYLKAELDRVTSIAEVYQNREVKLP